MLIERASATIPHVVFDGDMILDSSGNFRRTGSWWGLLRTLTYFEKETNFTTTRDDAIRFARRTGVPFVENDRTVLNAKAAEAEYDKPQETTVLEA